MYIYEYEKKQTEYGSVRDIKMKNVKPMKLYIYIFLNQKN